MASEEAEVLIVDAGQAGLAISEHLRDRGVTLGRVERLPEVAAGPVGPADERERP